MKKYKSLNSKEHLGGGYHVEFVKYFAGALSEKQRGEDARGIVF